jgi:hypothetical protein
LRDPRQGPEARTNLDRRLRCEYERADGGGQGSTGGDGAGAGKNTGNGSSGQQDSGGDAGKGKSLLGGRPTETLRSGAAPAGGGGGEVDAGKLAESILGAGF